MNMANISMARYSVSACLRRVFLALVLTGVCTSAFAIPAELMDQDGKKGGLQDFSGKPVIVFVTSLTEMAELGKWEEALRPKFSSINTIDIGDVNTSSKFILKELNKELKKHVPSGVRIYVDTQNIWAKEYSLDLFSPCVLIFNADHKMVAKFTGNPKGDVLDEVVAAAAKYFPLKAAPAK
jgi:hypothetical protein